AHARRDPRGHRGVARDEPRPAPARVPLRRPDDVLRLHAGGRHGQRPPHVLLPAPGAGPRRRRGGRGPGAAPLTSPLVVRILLSDVGPDGTEDLAAYRARGGYEALRQAVGGRSPAEILALVEAAGLRGRGGAAFPTARKWALAAGRTAPRKYVVANGGEHEPGSDKDKVLVTRHPHAVLEGMALCAFATGASEGVLYLIEDMAAPIASAERAIAEARAAGLLGADVLGSGFSFD